LDKPIIVPTAAANRNHAEKEAEQRIHHGDEPQVFKRAQAKLRRQSINRPRVETKLRKFPYVGVTAADTARAQAAGPGARHSSHDSKHS
jgi:hypothetical protein